MTSDTPTPTIPASQEPAKPAPVNTASSATAGSAAIHDATSDDTNVYAVHGADPEVLAYAMAKYSRSALSMKESLRELNSQRAEQFLNTFYFQYGHRSIADLAHVAFAVERLSLLAAIVLVDEQRWDGQERSTRYQNFRKSGWYRPEFGAEIEAKNLYTESMEGLFTAYEKLSRETFELLGQRIAKPEEMKQEAYDRTLRARAFDVARYLLPLAANTSLGQIVNARTLETQVSRLLTDAHEEVRRLGERLREAAASSAWNVQTAALEALQKKIAAVDPALGEEAAALLLREVKTAPTLVKYAAPVEYVRKVRPALEQAAQELMKQKRIQAAPLVDLVEDSATGKSGNAESIEIEIITTLLYGACHYPYRQIRDHVAALDAAKRDELLLLGMQDRGRHDELLRAFSSGYGFRFDILMDIGGFRDMHRHRRCVQTMQSFTNAHGYEVPELLHETPMYGEYEKTLRKAHAIFDQLSLANLPDAAATAQYVLPLGTRCRSLFKMDFAEAVYISELRSAPQGHISYRRVAWEMYQAIAKHHPKLAQFIRVTDIHAPVDPLQR
ncbi:MAG TPA: FAD-dependent thymidylate synthase [Acidobacteriaceae bacterium]|jgi:thymidylate synthase ThyX|nr:FAD-dependent thymidylate synthase [Acidobacteriaceae bacterium]